LVKDRFLTQVNEGQPCPAKTARRLALTSFFIDFIRVSDWPEGCKQLHAKVSHQGLKGAS